MHSLMEILVKFAVFGRFCFAQTYRGRSETYRQRKINSKHTVHMYWKKYILEKVPTGKITVPRTTSIIDYPFKRYVAKLICETTGT